MRFRLWAPAHQTVGLLLDDEAVATPMRAAGEGWHEIISERARVGTRYRFEFPDGLRAPDPASRFQPDDAHGPSEVTDPAAYVWSYGGWAGRDWSEAVLYELHVGAFTAAGDFRSAIERLDHLARLGVTALQIMPVADFPGARNWGYDGVLLYAPDSSYGRPDDLKALVDAAHARGLMVLLDVVYNHFGPDGNYLGAYAPQFFNAERQTPWGAAVNYDAAHSRAVRDFVIENALYWIEEFHVDGLRLDAVHAIFDEGPRHLLEELAEHARAAGGGRPIHLVLENEENSARLLARADDGAPLAYTAQWNDDVHHVLHVAATGEAQAYYAGYAGDADKLARALAQGFAYQGGTMAYRGSPRGEPSAHLPPTAFVAFIQNHDQVGNRAFGDRITATASPAAMRALTALYLLLPQIPMLFMGEEWAAAQPFPFFCDFGPDLAEAVRKGRREEFARFPEFADPATRERIPDPQAEATFLSAKLQWDDIAREPHAACLARYRRLLDARREHIVPLIPSIREGGRYAVLGERAVAADWRLAGGGALRLRANLSQAPARLNEPVPGEIIWCEGEQTDDGLAPWSLVWSLDRP